jgi:transposase, IS5 family
MRPRERRDRGPNDLFTARLDQIVDMNHALAKLARATGAFWRRASAQSAAAPPRLMAGLSILKHVHDLLDEVLCERGVESPCYQLFCGEEFFQHKLPFDRSSLTRWRQRMGEERLAGLLQESRADAAFRKC